MKIGFAKYQPMPYLSNIKIKKSKSEIKKYGLRQMLLTSVNNP